MTINNLDQLFDALVSSRTADQVRQVLAEIGDHAGVEINQPFGSLGLEWHAFGDTLSNYSSVGLGTKPGRSLTERVTNSMDAVLEARVPKGVTVLPESCRDAAAQWFGRPVTGPDSGLFKWNFGQSGFDRLVSIVLSAPQPNNTATVDVIDAGIGVPPNRFHDTILSLHKGNKLTKHYLIGAFGQGGASTLAFADYVVVMSRFMDTPDVVGFSVIRVMNLGVEYKEDAYAYLCLKRASLDMPAVVPSVSRKAGEGVELYDPKNSLTRQPPKLTVGTLVRHVGYKLPSLAGALGPGAGNLYHYLHVSMFDPLLPFRAIDLRDPTKAKDERINGSRNRLMRLLDKTKDKDKDEDQNSRIEIRHHRPLEFVTPHGADTPCVGIEYWVIYAQRKDKEGKGNWILRSSSNELFISKGHPIVGTLNGQNQGEETAKLLKDLSLTMVAQHIVVHIDASGADSRVRRELFSTNREGFKEGSVLDSLIAELKEMLAEDKVLGEIENELTERLTKRDTEQTNNEVKSQITKLLLESGFKVTKPGEAATVGGTGAQAKVRREGSGIYHPKPDPLPTLPYPQVTKWLIRHPEGVLQIPMNRAAPVLVETDADARFDSEKRIAIRSEPDLLEIAAKSSLQGGRIRWRLRPKSVEMATPGAKGKVIVTLTKPDGSQLQQEVQYELLPAKENEQKIDKGLVPPFEILPVSPTLEKDAEVWGTLWPNLVDNVTPEEQARVAYKSLGGQGEMVVYYSTAFAPYVETVEKLKQQSPAKAELFETFYAVWVGYHAILQEREQGKAREGLDEDRYNTILEDERVRVAAVQVKQALQSALMKYELTKASQGD